MIRKILPEEEHHFEKDPVRPHIPAFFRVTPPNETYVFSTNNIDIDSIICVSYLDKVVANEDELHDGESLELNGLNSSKFGFGGVTAKFSIPKDVDIEENLVFNIESKD